MFRPSSSYLHNVLLLLTFFWQYWMNSLERFCFFCSLCVLFQGLMPSTGIGLRQHTCKKGFDFIFIWKVQTPNNILDQNNMHAKRDFFFIWEIQTHNNIFIKVFNIVILGHFKSSIIIFNNIKYIIKCNSLFIFKFFCFLIYHVVRLKTSFKFFLDHKN